MLNDGIRGDLEKLKIFEFVQHHAITTEQVRLDALSEIVRTQAEKIL